MMARASAPAKVILFGEHFVVHGAPAILCAIDKRVTVAARTTNSQAISVRSALGSIEIPTTTDTADVDARLRPFVYMIREVVAGSDRGGGVSLEISSDIPVGVGLGSSSACCVAAAGAVSALFGCTDRATITSRALDAERLVFESVSGADTAVIASGGIIRYCGGDITQIKTDADFEFLVANSGQVHSTASVVGRVRQFADDNADRFAELCKNETELVGRAESAIRQGDAEALGALMRENQGHLKEIGVSTQALDGMIDTANKMGFGAKITGAGDGGCIISLASDPDELMARFSDCSLECFTAKIDHKGLILFNSP